MTPTLPELLDKLAALGSTAQIADFLRQEQIQGRPLSVRRCPVARYLQRELKQAVWVLPNTSPDPKYDPGGAGIDNGSSEVTPLPDLINTFANEFDECAYPDLIRDDGEPWPLPCPLFIACTDQDAEFWCSTCGHADHAHESGTV